MDSLPFLIRCGHIGSLIQCVAQYSAINNVIHSQGGVHRQGPAVFGNCRFLFITILVRKPVSAFSKLLWKLHKQFYCCMK